MSIADEKVFAVVSKLIFDTKAKKITWEQVSTSPLAGPNREEYTTKILDGSYELCFCVASSFLEERGEHFARLLFFEVGQNEPELVLNYNNVNTLADLYKTIKQFHGISSKAEQVIDRILQSK